MGSHPDRDLRCGVAVYGLDRYPESGATMRTKEYCGVMRVFDANRLIGAAPQCAGEGTEAEVLADLDHLRIDSAAVTPTWMVYGDPRAAANFESVAAIRPGPSRLVRIPVVIPGVRGAGWPLGPDIFGDSVAVRACPTRHRFELLGPTARQWWRDLSDRRIALVLDADEIGLAHIARLAKAMPRLRMLVIHPGYRELVRIAEFAQEHPLLHFETGTIVSAGAIEWLARTLGAHRLVFGTGAPLWDDAGPRYQLERLALDREDVALIASGSWELLVGDRA